MLIQRQEPARPSVLVLPQTLVAATALEPTVITRIVSVTTTSPLGFTATTTVIPGSADEPGNGVNPPSSETIHLDKSQRVAALAGGLVGGLAALFAICILVWFYLKRRDDIHRRMQIRKQWWWAAYLDKLRSQPSNNLPVKYKNEKKTTFGDALARPTPAIVIGDRHVRSPSQDSYSTMDEKNLAGPPPYQVPNDPFAGVSRG